MYHVFWDTLYAKTKALISAFVFAATIKDTCTNPLLSKSEISSLALADFCGYTARFVSEPVGKPEDRFSHDAAQIMIILCIFD